MTEQNKIRFKDTWDSERESEKLLRFAYDIAGNQAAAQNFLTTAFEKLWNHLNANEPLESCDDYMRSVIREDHSKTKDQFNKIQQDYKEYFLNQARRFLKPNVRNDAVDCVQMAFTILWERMITNNPPEACRAYAFVALRRECFKRNRQPALAELNAPIEGGDPLEMLIPDTDEKKNPDAVMLAKERSHDLNDCINRLPEAQAQIMRLELEDKKHQEIANALGIPIGTVRSRLFYAKRQLKICLESKGYE